MSTLALMRLLESAPDRYDWGMTALTLGRVRKLHQAIAAAAVTRPGANVLEIGCGTGTVAGMIARQGAHVTAVDQNPQMLEIARRRLADLSGVELREQTACEIDRFGQNTFDAVVASLCLSEMSEQERAYLFEQVRKLLAPGGVLVAGDEVIARGLGQRALQFVLRLPQALLGWALVGSVSRPIRDLPGELERAGFRVRDQRHYLLGTLAVVIAEPQ
jgi:cyclopropane fatty-acyl-phospholipid synthase-like methyltransferase